MAIQSFELLPESRFNACVIEPSIIGDHAKFPEAIAERQALEKQWFKPGQHGCPHCMGEMLFNAGEREHAGWFFDSSNWSEKELSPGQSLRFEGAITALKRNGLLPGGDFHPRIATTFVSTARGSDAAPKGRKACYRHSEEYSGLCRSREESEHEAVIERIESRWKGYLMELYPDCQVTSTLNRKAPNNINRRPDIDFRIQGTTCEGPVDFHVAVEVQKSRISLPTWQERNDALKTLGFAVWVYRQSRTGKTFKEMLTAQVEAGEPAYVYAIEGDVGSSDCNLILTPAAQGYPDFWGLNRATPTGTGNPVCQNPEYRQQKAAADFHRPRVSPQSAVSFDGFGSLARVLPGLSPQVRAEELAKVNHDRPMDDTPRLQPAPRGLPSFNSGAHPTTPRAPRVTAWVSPPPIPPEPPLAAPATPLEPEPSPEPQDTPKPAPGPLLLPHQAFYGWAGIPPWAHH